jgi:hypothetical protein
MAQLLKLSILFLTLYFAPTWTQQISGTQMWMNYPGLSTNCLQALNTSVACSIVLNPLSSRWVNSFRSKQPVLKLHSAKGQLTMILRPTFVLIRVISLCKPRKQPLYQPVLLPRMWSFTTKSLIRLLTLWTTTFIPSTFHATKIRKFCSRHPIAVCLTVYAELLDNSVIPSSSTGLVKTVDWRKVKVAPSAG